MHTTSKASKANGECCVWKEADDSTTLVPGCCMDANTTRDCVHLTSATAAAASPSTPHPLFQAMDISTQRAIFQAMDISTHINRGQIDIEGAMQVLFKDQKVGAFEVVLVVKLSCLSIKLYHQCMVIKVSERCLFC